MQIVHHDQTIEWIENDHGIHQPFPMLDEDDEDDEPRSVMKFNVTGFIVKSFLRDGGDYGHSLTLKLEDNVLVKVKAIISTSLQFKLHHRIILQLKAIIQLLLQTKKIRLGLLSLFGTDMVFSISITLISVILSHIL